jgi:hypothetical protein
MAQHGVPAGWESPADRPSIHQITVESVPGRRVRAGRPHLLVAIAVLGAIGVAIVIAVLGGGGAGPASPPAATPPPSSPPASAPAPPSVLVQSGPPAGAAPGLDRFAVGCRSSAATAMPGRPTSCWRGRLIVTVVKQTSGGGKVTLKPTSSACAPLPVPPLARGKVKGCPR